MPLFLYSDHFNCQSMTPDSPPFRDLSNRQDILKEALIYLIIIVSGIKSSKMRRTLIYLASLILSTRFLVSSGSCAIAPFPIVIGGSVANTYLYQIDYHAVTGKIVAVGNTGDTQVSSINYWTPFIVVY